MAQKSKGVISGAIFFVGIIGLFHMTQKASFAAIRTVDVVQLLASGACFGVGLMALVMKLREPRA
jgi:hypothetical protein